MSYETERWVLPEPESRWERLKLRMRGETGSRIVTFEVDSRGSVDVSAAVFRSMLKRLGYKPAGPSGEDQTP